MNFIDSFERDIAASKVRVEERWRRERRERGKGCPLVASSEGNSWQFIADSSIKSNPGHIGEHGTAICGIRTGLGVLCRCRLSDIYQAIPTSSLHMVRFPHQPSFFLPLFPLFPMQMAASLSVRLPKGCAETTGCCTTGRWRKPCR